MVSKPVQDVKRAPVLQGSVTTRLADELVGRLRRYILDHGLEVGDRLPTERALAEQLGTSRATVAQAFRILAVLGVVEIRHGSGVYVRHDPSTLFGTTFDLMVESEPESAGELAGFRYWIEQYLVHQPTMPDIDLERLAADHAALVSKGKRLEKWVEADADFHVTLVAATHNRYLTAAYENAHRTVLSVTYADWVERRVTPSWLRGEELAHQIRLHTDIFDAARTGDVDALAEALEAHQTELLAHLAEALDLSPSELSV